MQTVQEQKAKQLAETQRQLRAVQEQIRKSEAAKARAKTGDTTVALISGGYKPEKQTAGEFWGSLILQLCAIPVGLVLLAAGPIGWILLAFMAWGTGQSES